MLNRAGYRTPDKMKPRRSGGGAYPCWDIAVTLIDAETGLPFYGPIETAPGSDICWWTDDRGVRHPLLPTMLEVASG